MPDLSSPETGLTEGLVCHVCSTQCVPLLHEQHQPVSRLGDRAPEPERNPQLLMNLPWSRRTFDKIRQEFFVNISIIRAINRQAATFARTNFKYEGGADDLIGRSLNIFAICAC